MELHYIKTKWNGDPAADRDKFIGGSDIGTILGMNQFKSAYTLWAEKVGIIEAPDISDKEAVWWGNYDEQGVALRFCEKTGKKVHRSLMSYSLKEYPFLVGHVDRIVEGEDAGLECKTTSSWNKTNFDQGDIPPAHYCQCQFYMLVTGKPKWYYAVKRDNREFYYSEIDRNDDFIENRIIPAAVDFWEHVQTGEPVAADGSDSTSETLSKQYSTESAKDKKEVENLGNDAAELLKTADDLKAQAKELTDLASNYINQVKTMVGDYQKADAGDYSISWSKSLKTDIDKAGKIALQIEHPEIWNQYAKETESSRFTYRLKKPIDKKED